MNNFFKKLTLKVDKRTLLLVAGLVWGFARFIVYFHFSILKAIL
ncbi:hypothetical protein [Clostridium botulinum]|nr:hypothetical protein [Clostridium botulinum]